MDWLKKGDRVALTRFGDFYGFGTITMVDTDDEDCQPYKIYVDGDIDTEGAWYYSEENEGFEYEQIGLKTLIGGE